MADDATPESAQACVTIRPSARYAGKQGLEYDTGIAAETVGSQALCMMLLTIPPGGRAKAHQHDGHETAIYLLSGEVVTYWGARLENRTENTAGDLIYIPAGVPHLPINIGTVPASAVIARTDPNEQESVTLRPDLEDLVPVPG
ncbi:MAG: cupin domain-containing protein [Pseudomonadota bacterium]